ncbi:unnamed protein product [Pleuronectes platessa]|uniref:Uncharacterized protein n=1 Tax=Pleuronectes platessa TaxID=8262 RepID=A0A9N7Z4U7_PLEPL|nr:unnamed protein product [Pleuronectes platessa]
MAVGSIEGGGRRGEERGRGSCVFAVPHTDPHLLCSAAQVETHRESVRLQRILTALIRSARQGQRKCQVEGAGAGLRNRLLHSTSHSPAPRPLLLSSRAPHEFAPSDDKKGCLAFREDGKDDDQEVAGREEVGSSDSSLFATAESAAAPSPRCTLHCRDLSSVSEDERYSGMQNRF